jgi:hypothetical protein
LPFREKFFAGAGERCHSWLRSSSERMET